ncbi:YdbH domain-containing protein [Sulfuriflexus sp.]|uniref:YdbH domain-containing protein n=1 Tax=Sulfuriflexus sp. TaxID=2015443 RepID=UPI0028CFBD20|nr:YdbH domain-containing protein [Sulfuriflexus sp.]MDT8405420.1 YdbH domain-containing protein [Sulfuriflexus sp.]
MTSRGKYLVAIPFLLLLAAGLLLYRLTDVAAFILERELRAAGFTDIVVDIEAITTTRSKLTTLQASLPAFSLQAEAITLHYTLAELLDGRLDEVEIDSLQLGMHKQAETTGGIALPPLPEHWLAATPFKHARVKQARIDMPETIQGIAHLDLQLDLTHRSGALDAHIQLSAPERPPLLLQLRANDDNNLQLALRGSATTAPALTVQSHNLTVTPDKLNTAVLIEMDLGSLHAIATEWLPAFTWPAQLNYFDTFSSESDLEYLVTRRQLRSAGSIYLGGVKHTLKGPASFTYHEDQLAFVINKSFSLDAREHTIAGVTFPTLLLSVQDDVNCVYHQAPLSWHCGTASLGLRAPVLHYPPYALRSAPGTITLQELGGDAHTWRLHADLDLPGVNLDLPDNTIRLDRVYTQWQIAPTEIQASASIQAADGELTMAVEGRHDLQQQSGTTEIKLQPVTLGAGNNLAGKLLRHWASSLQLEGGQLQGQTQLSWQQQHGVFALGQNSRIELDNIQGSVQQYPFSGLQGKLYIRGIDDLRITTSGDLRLADINPGVPITDVRLRATASRKPGKDFIIDVQHLKASALGGRIAADATLLDLNQAENRLVLDVQGLDLARLMNLEQKQGLAGTGQLNGTLPLVLGKNGLSMENGKLTVPPPYGVIRYTGDERVTALARNNAEVEMLVKVLSNFHYNRLEAELDYAPDGDLLAKVRLQGKNPELQGGRPVHLNINLHCCPVNFHSKTI